MTQTELLTALENAFIGYKSVAHNVIELTDNVAKEYGHSYCQEMEYTIRIGFDELGSLDMIWIEDTPR